MSETSIKDEASKETVPGRRRSQVVINTANIVNSADTQLFPVLTNQIQQTTLIPIDQLGWIVSVRAFLQAVMTPMWGYWSDRHSRVKILAIGCFIWGICTILVGASVSVIDMFIFRVITGIGLSAIVPTMSSMIGDFFPPRERGKAYGIIGLTGAVGTFVGIIFAVVLVETFGAIYWRFCFFVFGIVSIAIGFLIIFTAKEPQRGLMDTGEIISGAPVRYQMRVSDFKEIFKNKTFMLIVAQGIAGTIPWNAIPFLLPWLEDIGFDFITAGAAFVLVGLAAAIGCFLGGWLGDKAAKWNPTKGRIMVAQISVGSGIPLIIIIFFAIPMNTSSLFLYVGIFALTIMLISWPSYSTNNPIFTELFEPEIRASVFSVDAMLEGAIAAFGPLIVTTVALAFGYDNSAAGQFVDAAPLAMGLFFTCLIPWIICLIFYTFVYFTYPKDIERIRNRLALRAEHQE